MLQGIDLAVGIIHPAELVLNVLSTMGKSQQILGAVRVRHELRPGHRGETELPGVIIRRLLFETSSHQNHLLRAEKNGGP